MSYALLFVFKIIGRILIVILNVYNNINVVNILWKIRDEVILQHIIIM